MILNILQRPSFWRHFNNLHGKCCELFMIIIIDDGCIVLVSNMTGKNETSDDFMWVALQMTIQNYYKCVIKYVSTLFMKKCYSREIKKLCHHKKNRKKVWREGLLKLTSHLGIFIKIVKVMSSYSMMPWWMHFNHHIYYKNLLFKIKLINMTDKVYQRWRQFDHFFLFMFYRHLVWVKLEMSSIS